MTYLVLARKWRPQTWEDVVSQEHVTVTLQNAIEHERLAHAYLFTGPRGVGKTSAARILAKSLNCETGPISKPCNTCSSCIEIADGRSIDVFEIDGASNRGIDEVRNLRENIQYIPAKGKYKIYIIDEVHMLTQPAFNALLKTLEEPPSHVLFIFATTEPHKVPATIVSRCQRFDFRRISTLQIIQHLKSICQNEKIEIDAEALQLIARKADGSLRDSQSILDQMVSFTEGKIKMEHVIHCLGLIEQEIFFEVTDVVHSKDLQKGMVLVEKVISGGYDIEEFLIGLTDHLRNLLIISSLKSPELLEVSEDDKNHYMQIGSFFKEEDILRLIRIVADTRISLKQNMNPRIPLELAIVKMIKLDQMVTISDLLLRLESLGGHYIKNHGDSMTEGLGNCVENPSDQKKPAKLKYGEPKSADGKVADSGAGEKKIQLTYEEVRSQWEEIIERMKHKKITVGSFLQEGVLLGVEKDTIQIGFGLSNGFHIDAVMRSKDVVLDVLREVFHTDVKFCCIKKDLPQKSVVSSQENKEKLLKELEEEKPVIKKIVDDFDAEIVS